MARACISPSATLGAGRWPRFQWKAGLPCPCRCRSSSPDRKSTRLNSSHLVISYAVFCLKKKKKTQKLRSTRQTTTPTQTSLRAHATPVAVILPLCPTWASCVLVSFVVVCFFFFNDTATTEIYTLSLHDALPIFNSSSDTVGINRYFYFSTLWAVDRKSTRLNSSHLVISYAVFCLKKKKKIHRFARRFMLPFIVHHVRVGESVVVHQPLRVVCVGVGVPRVHSDCFFFFNDPATPEIYPLSLRDALPI